MALSTMEFRVIYMIITIIGINHKEIQTLQFDTVQLPWKPWCKILKDKKTAICSGHGKNLTTIPNLPPFIENLHLDSDRFWSLTTRTFDPIVKNNISLKSLSLKNSQIHRIGNDAFENLQRLQSLDLSSNIQIDISSLGHSFHSLKNENLTSLKLIWMRLTSTSLSSNLFRGLSSKNIDLVSLSNNKLTYFPNSSLDGLKRLKRLDLSFNILGVCDKELSKLESLRSITFNNNKITRCSIEFLPKSLITLKLKNNGLRDVPVFCSYSDDLLLPELESLVLDGNLLTSIDKSSFVCIPNLKYLDLSFNNIRHIRSRVFSRLYNLEILKLSRMKQNVKYIDYGAFSIPSLRKLYFERNYFHFTSRVVSFSNCSKLEYLDLSYNYLPKWTMDINNDFKGLVSLRKIRLVQVYWNILPNNLFQFFPNIREVDLSKNKITHLNSTLFSNKSKIFRIQLDSNRIAHVEPSTFPDVFWRSIKIINLSGNPFVCDCDLLWFRDLLRKSNKMNITFKQYPLDYKCLSPPEKKGLRLSNFNMTSEECQRKSQLLLIISVSSGSLVCFGLLVAITIYRIRWHIRYWIYLLRYKKNGYNRIIDGQFRFDGFIIYSEEDRNFVHEVLLTNLENRNNYKMCAHYRDFEAGKTIVDNIVECMSQSRHALVVISKTFCQSKWCKFEMLLAQDRWLRNESDALVLVMLEDVNSRYMTKDLRALIQTTTYCLWTDDEVGQRLFWEQLGRSLNKDEELHD